MKIWKTYEKALELFGPNGEHWVPRPPIESAGEKCSAQVFVEIEGSEGPAYRRMKASVRKNQGMGLVSWNDSSTWPKVKAKFQRMARYAKRAGI